MRSPRAPWWAYSVYAFRAREAGFTVIEAVMASAMLLVVATSLSGLLASSVVTNAQSRERTLAEQYAMDQVEKIRRMPYEDVGVTNGNPPGALAAASPINVVGLHGTLKTEVAYVDDQTPNAYRTYANYKKVTVTVTRDRDSKQLTREVTYLSAGTAGSSTESVITPTVVDLGNNTPVSGATVNLSTGPSAPRSDVSDASGQVTFPALDPNPASGAQSHYDLAVVAPAGYQVLRDDVSPASAAHVALGTGASWPTTLRVYRPSTINVSVPSPPSSGSAVPYTLSVGSGRGAQAFAQAAGATSLAVTSIASGLVASEPVVPLPSSASGTSYTVGASAVSGTNYYYATAVTKAVPVAYPTDLTQSFAMPAGTWYSAAQVSPLTVKVQNSGGTAINGAQVAVSGGPGAAPGIYVTGVTGTGTSATNYVSGTISSPATAYSSGTITNGLSYSSGTLSSKSWSSGAWYTSVSANCSSQTAGSCNTTPVAGTITTAAFSFGSAIGSSSSYSVTLYKNGATTGSSCSIGSSQTSCTITGASVTVNGTSDTVELVVSRTSGSGTSYTGTAVASVGAPTAWGPGNWYTSVSANCTSQTVGACTTIPAVGTITGATFTFASAIASGASYTVTLHKNGATTGSSCTIASAQSSCTITGASVAVNGSSDTVVLVVGKVGGTSYTGNASASLAGAGTWSSGNWYMSVSANCASQTAGSCTTTPASAGTITGATFTFASAIAADASYSVALYRNGASTGSSCTIGHSQSTCSITGATVAVNGTSDTIVLVVSKTAGTSYAGTATASAVHSVPLNGQVVFNVPTGSGYTITAWGATTSSQLASQNVTGATTKTMTVS